MGALTPTIHLHYIFRMNDQRFLLYEVLFLFLFCITYGWTNRPSLVLASSTQSSQTQKYLIHTRRISYIFLLTFLYILTKTPIYDAYSWLFVEQHFLLFNTLSKCFRIFSVILMILSLYHNGFRVFSAVPSTNLFEGIYTRCRHPQTLSIILYIISITVQRNSVIILSCGICAIISLILLAYFVCFCSTLFYITSYTITFMFLGRI